MWSAAWSKMWSAAWSAPVVDPIDRPGAGWLDPLMSLHVEDRGGVAVVRLAHGKVNALDLELLHAITATFTELDRGDAAAVVLTGSGSAFSAGVDLWRILDGGV